MTVDGKTLDALRVVRNLAASAELDLDAPEWECIRIVTDRFDLAKGGTVPYPIERFRARPPEKQ